MAAAPQRRKPTYSIASVDNALRLLQMLRDLGEVRGKEAAEELGVSPSTVHRLMAMLVYRGFAVQNESRVYLPGPSVGVPPSSADGAKQLQDLARSHLQRLRDEAQESAYFMILTGRVVRFLLTAESPHPTRAGDRHGFVIPAHASAGGRAILSAMPDADVAELYRRAPDDDVLSDTGLTSLIADLRNVRARGYAVSVEEVEKGIVTVAAPVRLDWSRQPAAISLSGPASRRPTILHPRSIGLLLTARDRLESDARGADAPASAPHRSSAEWKSGVASTREGRR